MEISLMNRQVVAEPGQAASGVAGIGLMINRKTGIVEYGMMEDDGEFSLDNGCTGAIPVQKIPGEFFAPQIPAQVSGTPKDSPGSLPGDMRALREETEKKNRIVMGMGVLYNGGTKPVDPEAGTVPCQEARVIQNSTTDPAAPDPDPAERSGPLIFSAFERQERIYDRLNRKIQRLDKRLNKLEGRRMQMRNERQSE